MAKSKGIKDGSHKQSTTKEGHVPLGPSESSPKQEIGKGSKSGDIRQSESRPTTRRGK